MPKRKQIAVKGAAVGILAKDRENCISLTDIARYKDAERTDYLISNWLRNRNTIEYLGIWEQLNNPDFNPIEFDGIKKQAGLNSFILTAKPPSNNWSSSPTWRASTPCSSARGCPPQSVFSNLTRSPSAKCARSSQIQASNN